MFFLRELAITHFRECARAQTDLKVYNNVVVPPFAASWTQWHRNPNDNDSPDKNISYHGCLDEEFSGSCIVFVYRNIGEHTSYYSVTTIDRNKVFFRDLVAILNQIPGHTPFHFYNDKLGKDDRSFAEWGLRSLNSWVPIAEAKMFAEKFGFAEGIQEVWTIGNKPSMNILSVCYRCIECGHPVARTTRSLLRHLWYCNTAPSDVIKMAHSDDRKGSMHIRMCIDCMRVFWDEASAKAHQTKYHPLA